jgi:serine/threonine protein kinase
VSRAAVHGKRLFERTAVRIVMNLLRAYRRLHGEGILHLDGHGGNVLVEGLDPETLRLLDYGASARLENGVAHSWAIPLGITRSPEQIGPKGTPVMVTVESDLYYAGLMLAQLIQGFSPIARKGVTAEMFDARLLASKAPNLSGIANPALRTILERALAFEPEGRYRSAQSFIDALRPFGR